jgi:MEDS: MEthanogen/methylotroph, DcmR Sensory domain
VLPSAAYEASPQLPQNKTVIDEVAAASSVRNRLEPAQSVYFKAEMPFRETTVQGVTVHDHIVQFFDTTESLGAAVSEFVRDGLVARDTVLVAAGGDTWTNVAARLVRRAVDVNGAVTRRQLVVLDAATTLSRFIASSGPDRARFDSVVGGRVRELARTTCGRLRIYGEMVDVLAADAEFHAAVALEDLWNQLAQTVAFSLFCGYSSAHFGPQHNAEALQLILRCHSATRVDPEDALASWLLTRPPADDSRFRSRHLNRL